MNISDSLPLTLTRIFDAPRELVWEAWTRAEHALQWWGPRHHPATDIEWDARPGGRWRNCLRSVETGALLWHGGVFREVIRPERLVFTFAWEEPGERGLETLVTVNFTDRDGKTEMTLRQTPFQSIGERDGHDEGWNSTFDRLAEFFATSNRRSQEC
ncbi:MAG: SRPBCC domain-containing protein [Gammaproteobacteria bacterium]|nr:SRPBCC domain-containing protein [Gammaproteobacteria bacterium]